MIEISNKRYCSVIKVMYIYIVIWGDVHTEVLKYNDRQILNFIK